MGYTHRWSRPRELPADLFSRIRYDFERLLLPLSDLGVDLADWDGRGTPYFDSEVIRFNGLRDCGHPKNEEIVFPYPAPEARGIGPSSTAVPGEFSLGIFLKHRCCSGQCDYEPFRFPRVLNPCDGFDLHEERFCWGVSKTAFRPYDIAVTAALVIAKRHLGDLFTVQTNGAEMQWMDAKELCQRVLGYGDWFGVVEEQVKTASVGSTEPREVLLRTLVGSPELRFE